MTAGERYARDGYLCPVKALSPAEAAAFRSKLEAFEKAEPERAPTILRHKGPRGAGMVVGAGTPPGDAKLRQVELPRRASV